MLLHWIFYLKVSLCKNYFCLKLIKWLKQSYSKPFILILVHKILTRKTPNKLAEQKFRCSEISAIAIRESCWSARTVPRASPCPNLTASSTTTLRNRHARWMTSLLVAPGRSFCFWGSTSLPSSICWKRNPRKSPPCRSRVCREKLKIWPPRFVFFLLHVFGEQWKNIVLFFIVI